MRPDKPAISDKRVVIVGLVSNDTGFTAVYPQVDIRIDGASIKDAVYAAQSAVYENLLTPPLPPPSDHLALPVGTDLVIPLLVGHDEHGLAVARVADMVGLMGTQFVRAVYAGDTSTK